MSSGTSLKLSIIQHSHQGWSNCLLNSAYLDFLTCQYSVLVVLELSWCYPKTSHLRYASFPKYHFSLPTHFSYLKTVAITQCSERHPTVKYMAIALHFYFYCNCQVPHASVSQGKLPIWGLLLLGALGNAVATGNVLTVGCVSRILIMWMPIL